MAAELITREIRRSENDLRLVQACFAANGSSRTMESLRWQYMETPAPGVYVDVACDPGTEPVTVAGVHALLPVTVRAGGERRTAGQAVDTLTDARYRGRGLFLRLARSVYARCAPAGVAFVYGILNGSSAPGYFTRLDWVRLDPVPFLIRPLRTRYFLSRVPRAGPVLGRLPDLPLPRPGRPGERVEALREYGPELDALWGRFAAGIGVAVERDAAYLEWRLARKPGVGYEVRALRRDGRLAGLVAWTVREKHGGRIGYLVELLHDPGDAAAARTLAREAVHGMARAGADAVLAWNLPHSPNHAALRGAGFVTLPQRLRPIELHFGARALDPALAPLLADRRSWYLSYCDSDTV